MEAARDDFGKLKSILLVTIALVGPFTAMFLYLYLYEAYQIGLLYSILTALVTGIAMMVGAWTSRYVRCSMVLYLPQLLSGFGLLMLFGFLSWITISAPLQTILTNISRFNDAFCKHFNKSPVNNPIAIYGARIAGFGKVLHKIILLPLLLAFVSCFFYIFIQLSKPQPVSGSHPSNGITVRRFVRICYIYFHNRMSGMLVAVTLMTFVLEGFVYAILSSILEMASIDISHEPLENVSYEGWWTFYLVTSIIDVLMTPFAKPIKRFQKGVIRHFFQDRFPIRPATDSIRLDALIRNTVNEQISLAPSSVPRWNIFNRQGQATNVRNEVELMRMKRLERNSMYDDQHDRIGANEGHFSSRNNDQTGMQFDQPELTDVNKRELERSGLDCVRLPQSGQLEHAGKTKESGTSNFSFRL